MSLDSLLFKTYNAKTYNCAHFFVDAWLLVTGKDLSEIFLSVLLPEHLRSLSMVIRHNFQILKSPESPCLAVMTKTGFEPHVGMYYEGRIYHLKPSGAEYMPPEVAAIGFNKLTYYKC